MGDKKKGKHRSRAEKERTASVRAVLLRVTSFIIISHGEKIALRYAR